MDKALDLDLVCRTLGLAPAGVECRAGEYQSDLLTEEFLPRVIHSWCLTLNTDPGFSACVVCAVVCHLVMGGFCPVM